MTGRQAGSANKHRQKRDGKGGSPGGLCLPRPSDLLRRAEDVFGGRRGREEWGAAVGPEDGGGHGATAPQCHSAAAGWLPVAVTSEFDFVFMNFNPDAEGPMGWGATRCVWGGDACVVPFSVFFCIDRDKERQRLRRVSTTCFEKPCAIVRKGGGYGVAAQAAAAAAHMVVGFGSRPRPTQAQFP